MVLSQLLGELRVLIGNPPQHQVPDRDLMSFLIPSIQVLADHLKFSIVTDSNIGLVAEQREYRLPADLLYFVWVQVAGNNLQPNSVWNFNSGAVTASFSGTGGQTWMTIASGTPQQYAVQGRNLVLYPPASASFVANTPVMSWRYMSSGAHFTTEGSAGLTPQGIPALSDADEQLIRYDAAIDWISAHMLGQPPDQVQAMQATIAAYKEQFARRLPHCKRRWENMIKDYAPTLRPDTQGRFVAAR